MARPWVSGLIAAILVMFVLAVVGVFYGFYQVGMAATGRPNHVPRPVREFLAAATYQNSQQQNGALRINSLRTVVNLDGDHFPKAWSELCQSYLVSTGERLKACHRSLALNGVNGTDELNLGIALEDSGDYSAAADAYGAAYGLDPAMWYAQDNELWALVAAGKFNDAAMLGPVVIGGQASRHSSEPDPGLETGFAQAQLGRRRAALASYSAALAAASGVTCNLSHSGNHAALMCVGTLRGKPGRGYYCIGSACDDLAAKLPKDYVDLQPDDD